MADSLLIGHLIELLGGGVASDLPQCAGAYFHLGNEYTLGDPQPVVDFVATLMGDGERPSGWRMSNRTLEMPVVIRVPSTGDSVADRLTLAAAREVLLQVIGEDHFELIWAPDGSDGALNTVFDCWRAKASTVTHSVKKNKQLLSELTITFEALPYGRSDVLSTLEFDPAVEGGSTPISELVLDDFSTVNSDTQNSNWDRTQTTAYGTYCARWHVNLSSGDEPAWLTPNGGITSADLTYRNKLSFYLGLACKNGNGYYREWHKGMVNITVTLTDGTYTLSFGTQQHCTAGPNEAWPIWNQVSIPIPQTHPDLDYSAITGYTIKVWNDYHTWSGNANMKSSNVYICGLRAASSVSDRRPASDRGGEYVLYGIEGTAPAPVNVHLQVPYPSLESSTVVISLPGSPGAVGSYTAPDENPNWLLGDSIDAEGGSVGQWTGSDGLATNATLAASTTEAHAGSYSIRMTPTSGGSDMTMASCTTANIQTQGVPCTAGDRITVRCWVKDGGTARSVTVGVEFFSGTPSTLGRVDLSSSADSGTWTLYEGRVTAPASSAWARMLVTVATPSGGEHHYFDDLYFSWGLQAAVVCLAAGGAGGQANPFRNAGGGGGGAEVAWENNVDLDPLGTHAYSRGKGGHSNKTESTGGDGGDSYFTGLNVTVTAHGGAGGDNVLTGSYTQGSGGAGGTGSTNTGHYDGGDGGDGNWASLYGGGGGGAAADGGPGGDGSAPGGGSRGAVGALGQQGGRGGNGGYSPSGGREGFPGNWVGGGGGGATAQTIAHHGEGGADGKIAMLLTTYHRKSQVAGLLIHKPAREVSLLAKPVIPVGSGSDAPDGTVEYDLGMVDGQHARYKSTYSVILVAWSWNSTSDRDITVNFNQYEATGEAVSSQSVTATVDPDNVINDMVCLGEITLPIKDMPDDNTDSYFTVDVTSTDTNDLFLDVLLIDTRGQLVWIDINGSGYTDYWIDAPDSSGGQGKVLGSVNERSQAVSVLGGAIVTGGPMRLEPGDNIFMVYSPVGKPSLEGDYFPHWWHERLY